MGPHCSSKHSNQANRDGDHSLVVDTGGGGVAVTVWTGAVETIVDVLITSANTPQATLVG